MTRATRSFPIALVAMLLALFGAAESEAALSARDWQAPGDQLLTLDTATGLQWLDVTVAQGLSWDFVNGQLAPGGRFAGFRRPTDAEIVTFWRDAGIPNIALGASIVEATSEANVAPIRALQRLWGTTPYPFGLPGVTATLVTSAESFDPVDRMVEGTGLLRIFEGEAAAEIRRSLGLPPGTEPVGAAQMRVLLGRPPGEPVSFASHALVQAIPEPSTIALVVSGLAFGGCVGRRRRQA